MQFDNKKNQKCLSALKSPSLGKGLQAIIDSQYSIFWLVFVHKIVMQRIQLLIQPSNVIRNEIGKIVLIQSSTSDTKEGMNIWRDIYIFNLKIDCANGTSVSEVGWLRMIAHLMIGIHPRHEK